ncbi:hypothetical protein [Haloarcula montana]|uniref:hypothetical protein n=1 Tax=Haloarcula montana TaxID=3111776 RepID=UPI002D7967FD|nr:hypothetical protein [Haloarcula sp. GH36]
MYDKGTQRPDTDSGWAHVARHDESAAVIDAALRLDPEEAYTKTELSDAAGVPLKTLYLDGTLEDIVDIGLLTKDDPEGEEATFAVDIDSEVYQAASAFDDAVVKHLQTGD